jgi:hypothetical protein
MSSQTTDQGWLRQEQSSVPRTELRTLTNDGDATMYNLLIGLTQGEVGVDRMLEHTSDDVRQYAAPLTAAGQTQGEVRPDRILNLPALVMPETGFPDLPQIAVVGHITNLVRSGRNYTFTFMPNPAISPIPSERIEAAASALGISEWEFHRTHWAVKDVDLYRALGEHVTAGRPIPKVFRFPTEKAVEPDLVAVMMPFGSGFAPVYEALKSGVEAMGMRCLRADDIWERDHILDDVISLLWRARVVIADLSGKNPNVFYEAGIAHTLGRDTILVAQSLDDVPFDLRPIRTLQYLNNSEGRDALSEGVRRRLHTITTS